MTISPSAPAARRWRMLTTLDRWLEPVMIVLGLVWLALLVVEFAWGLSRWLELLGNVIWGIFVFEFVLRFVIAPAKVLFLRRNWITLLALGLPALRVLRIARALRLLRFTRGLKLVRLLTSMNRGLRSLGRAMQRRGAGYVGLLTLAVTLAGAAGMLVFEGRGPHAPFSGYGEALWWTGMLITTLGSDYWPHTTEGRLLTLILSIYAVGAFGYVAASLASFFIDRQEPSPKRTDEQFDALRQELAALRRQMEQWQRNK